MRSSFIGSLLCLLLMTQNVLAEVVVGEFLVKLKGDYAPSRAGQFMGKVSSKASLKASINGLNVHHMALKPGQSPEQFMQEMRLDPEVEYVEPNFIYRRFDDQASTDPRIFSSDDLSALSVGQGSYTQSGANVGQVQAWQSMKSSSDRTPVVAIIDTGLDYTHSVFTSSNALWNNAGEIANNGLDDDGNGYVDDTVGWDFRGRKNTPYDEEGHGTHVAGIVLGATQDIFASPIQESIIKIMPLRFMGADGSGSTADAVNAIYYAVNMGASVINCSWGGASYSQALHEALAYAYNRSVVVIFAAGNASQNNDALPMYPSNFPVPGAIASAATNDSDRLASFSNFGVATVPLSAPGVSVFSTYPGNKYRYLSGTSMAAPFVAGLAALAIREAPNLSAYQIRNVIVASVSSTVNLSGKVTTSGRVDSYNTVMNAKAQSGTAFYLPAYSAASLARSPDSEGGGSGSGTGCGLISTALQNLNNNPKARSGMALAVGLSLLPLIVYLVLRSRSPRQRRKHERFVMNSDIRVNMGGRELVGRLNTISLGGLSFQADSMLEKGGIVNIQIASPDGKEQVQVQGHIVWSEQNKAYGVQFDEVKEGVLSSISAWTSSLVKAR